VADNLAISIPIETPADTRGILRAIADLQRLQQAAEPATQGLTQLQATAQQSAQAIAAATAQGAQQSVAAATEQARASVRLAQDAAREQVRIAADLSRQQVAAARQGVSVAAAGPARTAAQEQLRAAQDLAREQQRLATDTGRAQVRAAQDAARAQVQAAREAAGQTSALRGTLGQALSGAGRGAISETVGGGLLIAGGLGVAALAATITRETVRFGTESVQAFAGYERALRETNALLGQTGAQSEATFRQMNRDVLEFSTRMGVDATQSARALYQAISAGGRPGADAMAVLNAAAQASIGGFTQMEVAVDGLTSVQNAYKLSSADLTRVNDQMFQTVNIGKLTYSQLAGSIGQVVPIAAQAGVQFNEIGGFLANATAQGVSTGAAVDGLRQILTSYIRPSEEARRVSQALGLEFNATALRTDGLAVSLERVFRATGGDPQLISRLFGDVQALNLVLASTGPNAAGAARAIDQVTNSAGAAARATEEVNKSTSRSLEEAAARWNRFQIEVGQASAGVAGSIVGIADALGTAIDAHREWAREFGGAAPAAGAARIVGVSGALTPEQRAVQDRLAGVGQRAAAPDEAATLERERQAAQEANARAAQEAVAATAQAAEQNAQAQAGAAAAARQRVADSVAAAHATEDAARAAQRAQQDAQQAEETAARERQRGVQSLQEAATAASRALQDVQDRLSQNQESLNQWLQAPIRGTRELEESLGRVQDRIAGSDLTLAQTRYEQIRARIEGAPPPTIDIEALRQAAMTRALASAEGDVLTARGRVELDPLERARRLAAARPEVSGPEAIANVRTLAPQVFADEGTIRQRTPAITAAQRAAQDAAAAAQRQEQAARDRLQAIQRDAQAAQQAAQDYAAATQRAQEIAQEGGQPTTARTPEQQARLDQLTRQAQEAAQRAQEASAAFQAQYAAGRAAGQGAADQLLLPSTIGTGPAASRVPPVALTFNAGGLTINMGAGATRDQIKAAAQEQVNAALDQFLDEALDGRAAPSTAPTMVGGRR
jgi:TP901 family phage tail tape measure protein